MPVETFDLSIYFGAASLALEQLYDCMIGHNNEYVL